ncbi:hypothetical protein BUALT_Bualt07G0116500 [Buddleja alternifolia]|uniref:WAT1-related protein n=1 Tax=Buddleja alternifolia TaxID=168488 RepID=A0AAV6XH09_9LAMI|nr:hypothetical protein BUALT_Bualt07G0116500 [Buddleja alternifolia]
MAQEKVTSERVKLLISLHILQLCFAVFICLQGCTKTIVGKERKTTSHILFFDQFFFLALVGITANQGFYILGLYYASPTFAYAMQNSVPAITFVMATALRIEQVHISRIDGMAKLLGTLASVGGATIITLYKGPPLLSQGNNQSMMMILSTKKVQSWTWGCIFLLGHCLSWTGWMVLQAPIVIPSQTVTNIIHILLRINPVPMYSSFCRKGSKALAN